MKRGQTSLKSTPLKRGGSKLKSCKLKVKPKTEEQKANQQEEFEKDREFYLEIWSERPHICVSCDKYLGEEPNLCFFEHCLEKGIDRYAHLRYCKENLKLVCHECHNLKGSGFPTEQYNEILKEVKRKFDNGELG